MMKTYKYFYPDLKEEYCELTFLILEKLQNVQRDERGRLLEGSKIASKSCCDPDRIWQLHYSGFSVKEIVKRLKCSKSTVYRVLKQEPKDNWINIGDNLPFN